jgi:hypothetical protein
MQYWVDRHPLAFGLADFLFLWLVVSFVISYTGGWAVLARKFRYRATFNGSKWRGESGSMRGLAHYGSCLVIGAGPEGLYLAVFFPFRIAHPPIFIPWTEVTFSKSRVFFVTMVRFQLGREDPVPLSIRESLANKIREASGNAWPIETMG